MNDNKRWIKMLAKNPRLYKSVTFFTSLRTLLSEVKGDPIKGIQWWNIQRVQKRALEATCRRLNARARAKNFDLAEVHGCLSQFRLRPEDEERVRWFKRASDKIKAVAQLMEKTGEFPEKTLIEAQRELSFIRQEKLFIKRFKLSHIYWVVDTMFNEINERLKEFKELKRQQMLDEKKKLELKVKLAEAKAQEDKLEQARLEKEKAEVLRDKRSKELKIIDAKRLAAEEKQRLIDKEREVKVAEDARQRAEALSASYDHLIETSTHKQGFQVVATNVIMADLIERLKRDPMASDVDREQVKKLIQALTYSV